MFAQGLTFQQLDREAAEVRFPLSLPLALSSLFLTLGFRYDREDRRRGRERKGGGQTEQKRGCDHTGGSHRIGRGLSVRLFSR
eukprot:501373-Amorphochlora_amoeboformis.AAC.1